MAERYSFSLQVAGNPPTPPEDVQLATFSNISYLGGCRMPDNIPGLQGDILAGQGLTFRYVAGELRVFAMAASQLYEVTLPSIGSLNPDPSAGPFANLVRYWGDFTTGFPALGPSGIHYDAGTDKMFYCGGDRYDNGVSTLCPLGACTLNANGTITQNGTWFFNRSRKQMNIAMCEIPVGCPILTHLPSGHRIISGFGAYQSLKTNGPSSDGTSAAAWSPSVALATANLGQVNCVPLIGYPYVQFGTPPSVKRETRDTNYTNEFDPGWNPSGGIGYQTDTDAGDQVGCFVYTGTKWGFFTYKVRTTGRTWYENSDLHCEGSFHEEMIHDPTKFIQVINGQITEDNQQWTSKRNIQYTGATYPLGGFDGSGGVKRCRGCFFDPTTNRIWTAFQGVSVKPGSFNTMWVQGWQVT
jgi:hypothetical protein